MATASARLYCNEGGPGGQGGPPLGGRMDGTTPRIAVYGGINVDIQARCASAYRAGDSNPGSVGVAAGGVGRNLAANLAGLGARVSLVSVFGDDDEAAMLKADCAARCVDCSRSLAVSGLPSCRYLCLLDADGTLVGAVADMDAIDRFGPDELLRLATAGDEADALVLDANLPADTLAAAAARWRDKPVILDPVSVAKAPRALSALPHLAMLKPNRAEAAALAGFQPGGLAEALAAAREIRKRGTGAVFVSLGPGGLAWSSPEGEGRALPPDMPVVNVSGAGDAAGAALAWSAALGYTAEKAAVLAITAAALCAASPEPVRAGVSAAVLEEASKGAHSERLS